jgi:hypothetical protein
MAYHSNWQSLSDAVKRVVALTACSQVEAETDICSAIADGAIDLRGKLKRRLSTNQTAVGATLERTAFQIPTDLDRSDLDWEKSCPLKPWIVRRGHFELPGPWDLEWIELLRSDVINALCAGGKSGEAVQHDTSDKDAKCRSRPARERALRAIQEIFPHGVPEQATLPNANLCRRVGEWLKAAPAADSKLAVG